MNRIAKGLKNPVGISNAGDGSGRLFVIEQKGRVRIIKNGKLLRQPFLDIWDRVAAGGEKGLLGLAFHPKFSETGRFFVNYTSEKPGLKTVISEFVVKDNADRANENTERILLEIDQPRSNHNGGDLAFGPDGFLYIGMGDGGSGNDPQGHGQNLNSLLGKMLRIDIDRPSNGLEYGIPKDNPFIIHGNAAKEIWAYGLRNPWRFSFDAVTKDLYVGDVGQNAREEINIIKRGRNYGWNIMEGSICTPSVNPSCDKTGLETPILDYPRSVGIVVIGGYVYRGGSIPDLCGVYLYADYGNGKIFGLRYDGISTPDNRLILSTRLSITSFGEDEEHELYLVEGQGGVFKIVGLKVP